MKGRRIGKLKDGKGNVYPILRMPREWIDLIGKNVMLERTMINGHEVIVIYTNTISPYRSVQKRGSESLQYNQGMLCSHKIVLGTIFFNVGLVILEEKSLAPGQGFEPWWARRPRTLQARAFPS